MILILVLAGINVLEGTFIKINKRLILNKCPGVQLQNCSKVKYLVISYYIHERYGFLLKIRISWVENILKINKRLPGWKISKINKCPARAGDVY